jgi:hypothetical protein
MKDEYIPKVGDKILLIKSHNGLPNWEGLICSVISTTKTSAVIKNDAGLTGTMYFDRSPSDEFCLASREKRAEFLKNKIEILKKNLADMEKEIGNLERFEDDEAEMAHKLKKLISAKDENAMAALLRELKTSHYL